MNNITLPILARTGASGLKSRTVLTLTCCLALPGLVWGADTIIGFDDLTPGTWVTGQYSSQGVTFSTGGFNAVGEVVADAQAPSPPNVLDVSQYGGEFNRSFIQGTFTDPHHQFISMEIGSPLYGGLVTINAFDMGSNLVGTAQVWVSPSGSREDWALLQLSSSGPNIAYFQVDGGYNEYIRLDDVTFDTLSGPPKPDFYLVNLTGSVVLVPAGVNAPNSSSTASIFVNMTRVDSSDGDIAYSVTGLPAGVSSGISPSASTGNGNDSITVGLSADSSAAPVLNQSVTLTATPDSGAGGYGPHSLTFNLTVANTYDARILNMEVTQGIQYTNLPERTIDPSTGDLVASIPYSGVDLADGGKTIVRVFANMKTALPAKLATPIPQMGCLLYGFDSSGAPLPGSPLQGASWDPTYPQAWTGSDTVVDAQRASSDDYRFTLPASWTHGTNSLQAQLVPNLQLLAPAVPSVDSDLANNFFTMTGISFLVMPSIYFVPIGLTVNNNNATVNGEGVLNPPWYVLDDGVNLLPLGEQQTGIGYIGLADFVMYSDITSIWNESGSATDRAKDAVKRVRSVGSKFNYFQSGNVVVGIFPQYDRGSGSSDQIRSLTYPGALGSGVSVMQDNLRPLTSAIHEVNHQFFRPHASGGGGASDTSNGCYEGWPPDQLGYMDGVGIDRRDLTVPVYFNGLSGPPISFGTANLFYDFMSYAGPVADNNDPAFWISPKGWEELINGMLGGEAYQEQNCDKDKLFGIPCTVYGQPPVNVNCGGGAGAAGGQLPGYNATGIQVSAWVSGTNVEIWDVSPQSVANLVPPSSSPYHLQALDAAGNLLQEIAMTVMMPQDGDSSSPVLLEGLVTNASVTDLGSLAVAYNGSRVTQLLRSANAPVVQITGVQTDVPIAGRLVTIVNWTASDADNDPLMTAVDCSIDGGQTWRGLYYGPNSNYLALASSQFSACTSTLLRLRVSDGFNETTAISAPFAEGGSPPGVSISSPKTGTYIRNIETLHCAGDAIDDRRQVIPGTNLTWYAGQKLLGQGASISVRGLAPGPQTLTLSATDYLGRTGSASVEIYVVRQAGVGTNILSNPAYINTNLVLWLTADTGVTADTNGNVFGWADQSGRGNDAIQTQPGAQPVLVTNGFQGLPVLHFGASGNPFLSIAGPVLSSQQFSIIAMVRDQGTTSNSRAIFSSYIDVFTGVAVSFGVTGVAPVYPLFENEFGPGDSVVHNPELFTVLSAVVSGIPSGPMETAFRQNQRVIGTAAMPAGQSGNFIAPYAIGALSGTSGDTFWRGDMAEILVYDAALSSNELQQVYGYLQTKYSTLPTVPQIDSITRSGLNVVLHFKTQANRIYVVQFTESLSTVPIVWTTLTNISALSSDTAMTVTDAMTSPQRFYRLLIPAPGVGFSASPTLVTQPATQISPSGANPNGTVLPNGSDTTVWFQYGTNTSYGLFSSVIVVSESNTNPLPVSLPLAGLAGSTLYHFRLVGFNNSGISYGGDMTFTTAQLPPTVKTLEAGSIGTNSAVLDGYVNPNGDSSTSVYFQYGATTSYGTITTQTGIGATAQNFSASIFGLAPGTTYHYRIVAANTGGVSYGVDMTFTTTRLPPTVQTLAATSVGANSAVLNGIVNPNGADTQVYFQYGITTSYGNTTTAFDLGSANYSEDYQDAVSLAPATTYHFRIVASNSGGTSFGADATLTTASLPQSPPTVQTLAASSVNASAAVLNGSVDPHGADTHAYFQYGATASYGSATATQDLGAGNLAQNVQASITVSPNTLYHYRIVAFNNGGTNYGADIMFTSLPLGPTVQTLPATSITAAGATLNGTVNPNGADTEVYFQYGTTTSYGNTTTAFDLGSANYSEDYQDAVSLAPATTYHFRIVASNSGGTSYGADATLTTASLPQPPPTVQTLAASSVTTTSAALNGTVNPNGADTHAQFQWGATTSYGNTTTLTDIGSATTSQNLQSSISGLAPSTTYHYRIYAYNSAGTTYGADATFTTAAQPVPTVTTLAATSIIGSSATLNASVNPNGASTTVYFQYGTAPSYGQTTGSVIITGTSAQNVSIGITGLSELTPYYFRVVAYNSGGTSYGSGLEFESDGVQ